MNRFSAVFGLLCCATLSLVSFSTAGVYSFAAAFLSGAWSALLILWALRDRWNR